MWNTYIWGAFTLSETDCEAIDEAREGMRISISRTFLFMVLLMKLSVIASGAIEVLGPFVTTTSACILGL